MQFLLRERSSEVIKLHDVEQSYNVEQSHDVELWHNAQFGAFIHRVGGKFPTKFLVWLCPRTTYSSQKACFIRGVIRRGDLEPKTWPK